MYFKNNNALQKGNILNDLTAEFLRQLYSWSCSIRETSFSNFLQNFLSGHLLLKNLSIEYNMKEFIKIIELTLVLNLKSALSNLIQQTNKIDPSQIWTKYLAEQIFTQKKFEKCEINFYLDQKQKYFQLQSSKNLEPRQFQVFCGKINLKNK